MIPVFEISGDLLIWAVLPIHVILSILNVDFLEKFVLPWIIRSHTLVHDA